MEIKEAKKEAEKLINELLFFRITPEREEKINQTLDDICPDPEWSDYIFYSEEFCNEDGSFDTRGVVKKIFSYGAICL